MNGKIFTLCLLMSAPGIALRAGEAAAPRPLEKIVPDLFDELDRSFRTATIDMISNLREGLRGIHEELETMGKQLESNTSPGVKGRLSETAEKVNVEFQLPSDLKYEPGDIDIINDKILTCTIKDEKYTINLSITLDRNVLTGQMRIKSEEKSEKGPRNERRIENSFQHRVTGTPNFDKISAEYDEKNHVLAFVIPKEFEIKNKRNIKVTVAK